MSKARGQHAGGMFDRPGRLLTGAAVIVSLSWLAFTAGMKAHELLLGLIPATLTVLFFANVLRTETLNLNLTWRDLAQARSIPWAILSGSWLITVVLFKDLAGKRAGSFYRACGFKTSRHNPTLVGRTALAVLYSTAAPNTIIIGVDPAQSLMLFFQLQRTGVGPAAEALGAHQ